MSIDNRRDKEGGVCVCVCTYICIYDIILFDCKKERNPAICNNIDGP